MVWSLIIVLVFTFFSIFIPSPGDNELKIKIVPKKEFTTVEGIYRTGAGGAVTIRKIKDVHLIQWTNGDAGVGHWDGKSILTVAFGNKEIVAGLAVYHLEMDGDTINLVGEYTTLPGKAVWGKETLVKVANLVD